MKIVHDSTRSIPHDAEAITYEQILKRRVQRRRRVAKRKLASVPMFAVEEMQHEFPGYTYEEFVADVTRKTRKSKKIRKPKPKAFDWKVIAREAPDLFRKCRIRTKTKAVLFARIKGIEVTVVVRSSWFDGQGQRRLDSYQLIRLFQGTLKDLAKNPAVLIYEGESLLEIP